MAHVTIRRNIQGLVIRIRTSIIIWCMASGTGIWRIVVIPVMAGIAVVCNVDMCSGQGIKSIVVEGGRDPGCFVMAILTSCRELV